MMKFVVILILSFFAPLVFAGGDNVGSGGDTCENSFTQVRNDLSAWILKGGAKGLHLPEGLSLQEYSKTMLQNITSASVSCTNSKISIGSAEKTCKNFVREDGRPHVVCNADRFAHTNQNDRYILVHHEYAGLSGFERSYGEASHYEISNQIVGFLEDQVVRKLVVKNEFDANYCGGKNLTSAADLIPPGIILNGDSTKAIIGGFSLSTRERHCQDSGVCTSWQQTPNRVANRGNTALLDRGSIMIDGRPNLGLSSLVFVAQDQNRANVSLFVTCMPSASFDGRCEIVTTYPGLLTSATGQIREHCAWIKLPQRTRSEDGAAWLEREIVLIGTY